MGQDVGHRGLTAKQMLRTVDAFHVRKALGTLFNDGRTICVDHHLRDLWDLQQGSHDVMEEGPAIEVPIILAWDPLARMSHRDERHDRDAHETCSVFLAAKDVLKVKPFG